MTDSLKDIWTPWGRELRTTWLWLFFLSVLPCALFGTAFFSMIILAGAVLIAAPVVLIGQLIGKGSKKSWRQLVVMAVVPVLSISFALHSDERTPKNAAPIAKAIMAYRAETGRYPESLDLLIPKHLSTIPSLRFSIIQPEVTYRLTDGKPYLTIPSASGDQFANFEYNFETQAWIHNS